MSNLPQGGRFKVPGYPEVYASLTAATKLQEGLNLGLVNPLSSPMAAVLVSIGLLAFLNSSLIFLVGIILS